jgi:hypothetical protein
VLESACTVCEWGEAANAVTNRLNTLWDLWERATVVDPEPEEPHRAAQTGELLARGKRLQEAQHHYCQFIPDDGYEAWDWRDTQ